MIEAFCQWLAATPWSQTLARLEWVVPLAQSIHILALAAVLTALLLMTTHVLRPRAEGAVVAQRLAAPFKGGLWTMLASGLLLVSIEPARELLNNAFRVKMLLLPLLLASALWTLERLRRGEQPPRAFALFNLLVVVAMVALGRFIAYI